MLLSAVLIQATLAPLFEVNGIHPDIVVVLVIAWALLRGFEEGLSWALLGGLSLDFLSGETFGIFSLAMVLVAVLAAIAHGRAFDSSFILPLILCFPLSLIFNGMGLLILDTLGRNIIWDAALFGVLLPVAVYNVVVMLVVFPPLYWLDRRLNPQTLRI